MVPALGALRSAAAGRLSVQRGGLEGRAELGFSPLAAETVSFSHLFALLPTPFPFRAKYAVSSIKKKVSDKNPHVALYALEVTGRLHPTLAGPVPSGQGGRGGAHGLPQCRHWREADGAACRAGAGQASPAPPDTDLGQGGWL